MKPHYKEYKFSDWVTLSEDIKRDIQNHYWTPFDSMVGEKTRIEILEEFIKTIDIDYYLCEFGYFSHYVIGIKFIPKDSNKKLPKDFHGIVINKGKIIEWIDSKNIKVGWRHSGSELIQIKK